MPSMAAKVRAHNAQVAQERAHETVWTYYLVPRDLLEQFSARGAKWIDLVSAADAAGCSMLRLTKRELAQKQPTPVGFAAVYEGIPGAICVAKENW